MVVYSYLSHGGRILELFRVTHSIDFFSPTVVEDMFDQLVGSLSVVLTKLTTDKATLVVQ